MRETQPVTPASTTPCRAGTKSSAFHRPECSRCVAPLAGRLIPPIPSACAQSAKPSWDLATPDWPLASAGSRVISSPVLQSRTRHTPGLDCDFRAQHERILLEHGAGLRPTQTEFPARQQRACLVNSLGDNPEVSPDPCIYVCLATESLHQQQAKSARHPERPSSTPYFHRGCRLSSAHFHCNACAPDIRYCIPWKSFDDHIMYHLKT